MNVVPVAGATVVQPDERVVLSAGNVTVIFPTTSRARTFQAMLVESGECVAPALACAALTIWTAEGEPEHDVRLIMPAELIITLGPGELAALGGPNGALQLYADGRLLFQVNDEIAGRWNSLIYELDDVLAERFTLEAETRSLRPIPYVIGMTADIEAPTATPEPVAFEPTPTPTPFASFTPVVVAPPTPTPFASFTPVVVAPPTTGDSGATLSLVFSLAAMALFTALLFTALTTDRIRPPTG